MYNKFQVAPPPIDQSETGTGLAELPEKINGAKKRLRKTLSLLDQQRFFWQLCSNFSCFRLLLALPETRTRRSAPTTTATPAATRRTWRPAPTRTTTATAATRRRPLTASRRAAGGGSRATARAADGDSLAKVGPSLDFVLGVLGGPGDCCLARGSGLQGCYRPAPDLPARKRPARDGGSGILATSFSAFQRVPGVSRRPLTILFQPIAISRPFSAASIRSVSPFQLCFRRFPNRRASSPGPRKKSTFFFEPAA